MQVIVIGILAGLTVLGRRVATLGGADQVGELRVELRLLVNLKMIEPSSQIVDLVMDSVVSHLDIISRPPVGMGVARRTRRGIVAVVVIHGHAVVIANSVGMGVTRRTHRGIVVAVTVDIHVGIRMTVRIRHFRCGIGVDACPLPVPRHIGITVRAVTGVVAPTLQPGTRVAARHITHATTAMPGPVVRTSNRRGTRIAGGGIGVRRMWRRSRARNITGPGVGGGGLAVGGAFDQPQMTWPQPRIVTEDGAAHHPAVTLMDTGVRVMRQQDTAAIGVLIRDTQVVQRLVANTLGLASGFQCV